MRYQDSLDLKALKQYVASMNNRAKSLGVQGVLDVERLQDRIFACAGLCEWCGRRIVDEEFEIDHILSLANDGQNTADNLAVACVACNRAKSAKHPARFAAEIAAKSTHQTPLVQSLLTQFALSGSRQMMMFEEETLVAEKSETDSSQPYIWKQNKTNQT